MLPSLVGVEEAGAGAAKAALWRRGKPGCPAPVTAEAHQRPGGRALEPLLGGGRDQARAGTEGWMDLEPCLLDGREGKGLASLLCSLPEEARMAAPLWGL